MNISKVPRGQQSGDVRNGKTSKTRNYGNKYSKNVKQNEAAQGSSGLMEVEPDWFDDDDDEEDKPVFTMGPDGKETLDLAAHKRRMKKISNASKRERWQKEEPLRNVRALVLKSRDGVWSSELIQLYRETYGHELKYEYYATVACLARQVPNLKVTYCADRGDFLIYDKKRPMCYKSSDEVAVYPLDCMQRGDQILPAPTVVEVMRGDTLEVCLSEIYSPSIFWLRRVDKAVELSHLTHRMRTYYQFEFENYSRRLQPGAIQQGYYCATIWKYNEWRRSLIVKVMEYDDDDDPRKVKVWHVDYGSLQTCSARNLWPLPIEFSRPESQAIRGRLAGVQPAASGLIWPHDANKFFVELAGNCQRFSATVTAKNYSDLSLEMALSHKVAGDIVSVADELVRAGHADPRSYPAQGTEYYLHPNFNVLERGDTLSFEEIGEYLRADIDPFDIEAYRRHMPPRPNESNRTDRRTPSPEISEYQRADIDEYRRHVPPRPNESNRTDRRTPSPEISEYRRADIEEYRRHVPPRPNESNRTDRRTPSPEISEYRRADIDEYRRHVPPRPNESNRTDRRTPSPEISEYRRADIEEYRRHMPPRPNESNGTDRRTPSPPAYHIICRQCGSYCEIGEALFARAAPTVANIAPPTARAAQTVANIEPTTARAAQTMANIAPPIARAAPTVANIEPPMARSAKTVANILPPRARAALTAANIAPPRGTPTVGRPGRGLRLLMSLSKHH